MTCAATILLASYCRWMAVGARCGGASHDASAYDATAVVGRLACDLRLRRGVGRLLAAAALSRTRRPLGQLVHGGVLPCRVPARPAARHSSAPRDPHSSPHLPVAGSGQWPCLQSL